MKRAISSAKAVSDIVLRAIRSNSDGRNKNSSAFENLYDQLPISTPITGLSTPISTATSDHGPFLWEQALASLSLPNSLSIEVTNKDYSNYYEFDHDDDSDFGVSECDESDGEDSHLDLSSAPTSPNHDNNPNSLKITTTPKYVRRKWFPSMTWRHSKGTSNGSSPSSPRSPSSSSKGKLNGESSILNSNGVMIGTFKNSTADGKDMREDVLSPLKSRASNSHIRNSLLTASQWMSRPSSPLSHDATSSTPNSADIVIESGTMGGTEIEGIADESDTLKIRNIETEYTVGQPALIVSQEQCLAHEIVLLGKEKAEASIPRTSPSSSMRTREQEHSERIHRLRTRNSLRKTKLLSKREYKGRIWYKDEGIWVPELTKEEERRAADGGREETTIGDQFQVIDGLMRKFEGEEETKENIKEGDLVSDDLRDDGREEETERVAAAMAVLPSLLEESKECQQKMIRLQR
jgi:hypothetical protein